MRWDMNEVIVDTGRVGMWVVKGEKKSYQKIVRNDYEDAPLHESMSRHRKNYGRSQGDRLSPLRQYLRSNVGRKWDDVYSEICAVNDKRTILGFHLITHLRQYVWTGPLDTARGYHYPQFFADPATGILYEARQRAWKHYYRDERLRDPIRYVKVDAMLYYEIIKGIWFRMDGKMILYKIPRFIWPDGVVREEKEVEEVVWSKRQVGKKELRAVRELLRKGVGVIRQEPDKEVQQNRWIDFQKKIA